MPRLKEGEGAFSATTVVAEIIARDWPVSSDAVAERCVAELANPAAKETYRLEAANAICRRLLSGVSTLTASL